MSKYNYVGMHSFICFFLIRTLLMLKVGGAMLGIT